MDTKIHVIIIARKAKFCNHRRCFVESNYCIFSEFVSFAPNSKMKGLSTKRKPYYQNESRAIVLSCTHRGKWVHFLYAIFQWVFPRGWQRRKNACIIHISGCICHFALGFCKNIKKRTETLYQSFSPFMVRPSENGRESHKEPRGEPVRKNGQGIAFQTVRPGA